MTKPDNQFVKYQGLKESNTRSTLHLRNWDSKPMQARPEDLERGVIRRKTEDILESRELDSINREVWD